jgi:hypothetical protein
MQDPTPDAERVDFTLGTRDASCEALYEEPARGPRWQWATPADAVRLARRPERVYERPGMAVVA